MHSSLRGKKSRVFAPLRALRETHSLKRGLSTSRNQLPPFGGIEGVFLPPFGGIEGGHKKRAMIEIAARINPISYEKPCI